MNGTLNDLLVAAAALLRGEPPEAGAVSEVHRLLAELGYARTVRPGADDEALHRANLLQAASHFARMFELTASDAPGLVAFGAEIDPASADVLHRGSPLVGVSGIGLTMQEAFQGCVGEGIEYLSQLQRGSDALVMADGLDPARALDSTGRELVTTLLSPSADAKTSWYSAIRLSDRRQVLLPADLCLRRPPALREFAPPFPPSIGSAAGTSREGAALHGLLELIERDAASLWWRGGRRGRAVPGDVEEIAQAMLRGLRASVAVPRRSWLLDITTGIGAPAIAALSCRPDGFGLAFGLAARPTLQAAARSAVLEMCQIELALAVVEAKRRERGDAALNATDRNHLQRASGIDAHRCALLQPASGGSETVPLDAGNAQAAFESIVRRLAGLGIEAYSVDLTRPDVAVPVVRIVAPGLQAEPSSFATARLSAMIAQTGGGAAHVGAIPLI